MDVSTAKFESCFVAKLGFVIALSCGFLLSSSEAQSTSDAAEDSKVQIIRPESYAVRRFSEVLETELAERSEAPKELLIRNRALFEIAKKKLLDLKDLELESDSLSLKNKIKAWEAKTDYYRKRTKALEETIKKTRGK